MKINTNFEHIRSIYAPDDFSAYARRAVLGPAITVDYGSVTWPSRSYWIVPGTIEANSEFA